MKKELLIIGALLMGLTFSQAMGQTSKIMEYEIGSESKLWFNGTSTMHDYIVHAKAVQGFAVFDPEIFDAIKYDSETEALMGELKIPVTELDSGKEKMDKKMFKSLKLKSHQFIEYKLQKIKTIPASDSASFWTKVEATGKLTVAGVEKTVVTEVVGYKLSEKELRFSGSQELFMKDFGIKPPSMMLGVLKTGNKIVIHFNLQLNLHQETTAFLESDE